MRTTYYEIMDFMTDKFDKDEMLDVGLRIAEGLAYGQILIVQYDGKIRGCLAWWQTDEQEPQPLCPPKIKTGGNHRHYSVAATDGTTEVAKILTRFIRKHPGTWHRKKYNGRLGGVKCLKSS